MRDGGSPRASKRTRAALRATFSDEDLRRRVTAQACYLAHRCVAYFNRLEFLRKRFFDHLEPRLAILALTFVVACERRRLRRRDVAAGLLLPPGDPRVELALAGASRLGKANFEDLLTGVDPVLAECLRTAHPEFYLAKIAAALPSDDEVREVCAFNNRFDDYHVRVSSPDFPPSEFRRWCEEAGVEATPVPEADFLFHVDRSGRDAVVKSPEYRRKHLLLQDRGSVRACLAVEAAVDGASNHKLVVEVGAAPFVKTSLLVQLAGNLPFPRHVAIDYSLRRLKAGLSLFDATGTPRPEMIVADGCHLPLRPGTPGVGFLDAPCTSSGALNARPEMKWKQSAEYLESHARLQRRMLLELWNALAPGSAVVFATCSVYREEGEGVVNWLSGRVSDLERVDAERTWPHVHRCQGFFVARLKKCS
ncbi:MAG: hypothetical protein Kow0069_17140 [Promethearchaeota archaeon]